MLNLLELGSSKKELWLLVCYVICITSIERVASRDVTIRGMQIPKGMAVEMLVYNIHHDSDYWKDPEIFNPDR